MIRQTPIGDRRTRIEIRAVVTKKNDWGQVVEEREEVIARPWAARLSHSGRRFFQAQQMRNEISEIFNIAYLAGIAPGMKVAVGTDVFEILDVDDREGRHVEIDLACRKVI